MSSDVRSSGVGSSGVGSAGVGSAGVGSSGVGGSGGWNEFWFARQPTSALAAFRIVFGLLVFLWTVSLTPDVLKLFGPHGVLPSQPNLQDWFGMLGVWNSNVAVLLVYAGLLVTALLVCVGCFTRVSAVLMWLLLLTLQRRDPWVLNSGDLLLRNLAFYLMLAPAGAALSVDRWRQHRDEFWEFPARAVWPIRLIQIQLSVLYLVTLWDKVQGATWNNGTAVSYALRIDDLARFTLPGSVTHSLLAANLMTYSTLAIEFCLAVLVWNGKARPWVLLAGVLFHLGIDLTIEVGFFSFAILAAYLVWLPPEATARWFQRRWSKVPT